MNTGIYRRIDNLGRIVLPKEIRRMLYIEEGDILEISVSDSKVILSPYTQFTNADIVINTCLTTANCEGVTLAVVTKHDVYACSDDKSVKHTQISDELKRLISDGKEYISNGVSGIPFTSQQNVWVTAMFPLLKYGELHGALVMLGVKRMIPSEEQIMKERLLAEIISSAVREI